MNLIIFDIDGTLTQTNHVDSDCFSHAFKDTLQIRNLNTDWSSYQYSTDSGLLKEIFEYHFNSAALSQQTVQIQQCFLNHLKTEYQKNTKLFEPLPGAENIFKEISKLPYWHIAIATGGWQLSALFKLKSAGIPHIHLPKAFADDHIERTEIIKIAIQKAKIKYSLEQYQQTIYVGDKPWDHQAARQLNIGFIGIGSEFRQRTELCDLFLEDYRNHTALIEFLQISYWITQKTLQFA